MNQAALLRQSREAYKLEDIRIVRDAYEAGQRAAIASMDQRAFHGVPRSWKETKLRVRSALFDWTQTALTFAGGAPSTEKIDASWNEPVFVRNIYDQNATWETSQVSPELIRTSQLTARRGNLQPMASLNDLMVKSDPHIAGVRLQRKMGIASQPFELVPANDGATAKRYAELVKKWIATPGASFVQLIAHLVEAILRGVGAVEVLWKTPVKGQPRLWSSFRNIPQARLRYDYWTGKLAFAENATLWSGLLFEGAPAGRFILVEPELDILDQGLRGVYRSWHSPWQDRLYGRKWRRDFVERFGLPIPVGFYRGEKQRQAFIRGFTEWGANGGLVVEQGGDFRLEQGVVRGVGEGPQAALMTAAADEISISGVGQTQTVTVRKDQGSKASAQTQNLVREDIALGDWAVIGELLRDQLFAPALDYNEGEGAGAEAPFIVPKFDKPVDLFALAQALDILVGLGLKVGVNYVQRTGSIPDPGADEDLLEKQMPPPSDGLPDPGKVLPFKSAASMRQWALLAAAARGNQALSRKNLSELTSTFMPEALAAMKPVAQAIRGIFEEVEAEGGTLEDVRMRVGALRGSLPMNELGELLMATEIEAALRGWTDSQKERGADDEPEPTPAA